MIKRDNTQTLQQPPRLDAALKRVGGQRRRDEGTTVSSDGRTRWLALIVLYLGALMIVLDTTIVNVALPSIRASLGFSETSLAWVVNAYMLTFGGFLLLGGRLGDLFGHRRLFLMGIIALHAGVARLRPGYHAGVPRLGEGDPGAWRSCRLGGRALAGHEPVY